MISFNIMKLGYDISLYYDFDAYQIYDNCNCNG